MSRFVVKPARGTVFGAREGWAVVDTGDGDREVNRYVARPDADARAAELNAGPLDLDTQEAWLPDEVDEDDEDDGWGSGSRW